LHQRNISLSHHDSLVAKNLETVSERICTKQFTIVPAIPSGSSVVCFKDGLPPTVLHPEIKMIASPEVTTTYVVIVTDANGCTATDSLTVIVVECTVETLFIPTAFSPNGDGLNDMLNITVDGEFDRINFRVQDRWGKTVFETDNTTTGWDGRYNGKLLSTDAFGYCLQIFCNQDVVVRQGNITLVQ